MTRDQALAHASAVLGAIAPEVDLAAIDPTERLRDEADIDSMDFQRLVAGIAARTGVEIPESAYPQVATLDGLLGWLEARG